MDNRNEVREFLTSRRSRVTPEQVQLPPGTNRRVPGLRRSEVAMLAGVSLEYFARVERGNLAGASESVLDAIAAALLLDEAERAHLSDLARAANESPVRAARLTAPQTVRPVMQLALDAVTAGPAFVRNGRMDVLAENALFRVLYSVLYAMPQRPVSPGSCFCTAGLLSSSTPTGRCRPTSTWRSYAPRRVATLTTRRCTTSSENCRGGDARSAGRRVASCGPFERIERASTGNSPGLRFVS